MGRYHAQRWGSRAGYTLTEAVLIISIIGILGAVAAPRFLGPNEADLQFFRQDVLSALRYGRKLAVASRCPVQVDFSSSSYELLQRANCESGGYSQDVFDPATGVSGFSQSAPSGVTLSSTLDPLYFDALGRVVDASDATTDVTISVGALTISARGESGFINAP